MQILHETMIVKKYWRQLMKDLKGAGTVYLLSDLPNKKDKAAHMTVLIKKPVTAESYDYILKVYGIATDSESNVKDYCQSEILLVGYQFNAMIDEFTNYEMKVVYEEYLQKKYRPKKKRGRKEYGADIKTKVLELKGQKKSHTAIAQELGIGRATVSRILKRAKEESK